MAKRQQIHKRKTTTHDQVKAKKQVVATAIKVVNNRVGRPSVMTQRTLNLLHEAYAFDCTDAEACLYAGISTVTLAKYKNDNPEFVNEIILLRQTPVLMARSAVIESFKSSPEIAFKYLERKARKEFATTPVGLEQGGAMAVLIALGIVKQQEQLTSGDEVKQ